MGVDWWKQLNRVKRCVTVLEYSIYANFCLRMLLSYCWNKADWIWRASVVISMYLGDAENTATSGLPSKWKQKSLFGIFSKSVEFEAIQRATDHSFLRGVDSRVRGPTSDIHFCVALQRSIFLCFLFFVSLYLSLSLSVFLFFYFYGHYPLRFFVFVVFIDKVCHWPWACEFH